MDETLLTPQDTVPLSPFLPGTNIQFAWDSTSIGLLKTCPRLYHYKMIEGYQPKSESIHLFFGGEFHQACQDYDLNIAAGLSHEAALADVVRELLIRTVDFKPDTSVKPGKYKNRESLLRAVVHYLDERPTSAVRTYILSNGRPAVELSFRFELEFGPTFFDDPRDSDPRPPQPYLLCGHLDRVITDPNGDLFVEDHKTTTSTPGPYYFAQYDMANQMSLYAFAGKVVLDAPIRGVMINAVQLLLTEPYTKFVHGFTFRNNDQLEEWLINLSYWFQMAEWYATNDIWPANESSCDKFSGCDFRNVCSKAPNVRHIYLNSDFVKLPLEERWNPLKSR